MQVKIEFTERWKNTNTTSKHKNARRLNVEIVDGSWKRNECIKIKEAVGTDYIRIYRESGEDLTNKKLEENDSTDLGYKFLPKDDIFEDGCKGEHPDDSRMAAYYNALWRNIRDDKIEFNQIYNRYIIFMLKPAAFNFEWPLKLKITACDPEYTHTC